MNTPLFDPRRRARNRERAKGLGGDLFLHRRALDDIADRLAGRAVDPASALIVGPLDAPNMAATHAEALDRIGAVPGTLDLIVILGELEVADDLPPIMAALRHLLRSGGTLTGCVVGGNSLPRLRAALLEADRSAGRAAQRTHPMLDGASLSSLLQGSGFRDAVVEVDRVTARYASLDRLVADLRAMGCTNALAAAPPPLTKSQFAIARDSFLAGTSAAEERFELLHFTAKAR